VQINENRDLYDLCRKYKFFYKQHEEIKKLDTCYWNKHIREAYKKSERDLNNVTKEIIKLILKDFIYDGGVEIKCERPFDEGFACWGDSRMRRVPFPYKCVDSEVIFHSEKLATIIKEIINDKGWNYGY
jgi:hypothetical protein